MKIGNRDFDTKKTYIMGILNVTPDSFSDGGEHDTVESALRWVEQMVIEGADVIDVGGESTRPGYKMISDEEEIGRVVPVIERIRKEYDIPISIDTYKSGVAKAAIEAGAHIVNDVWGLKYDGKMAKVIADGNAACVLMHNKKNKVYSDFVNDTISELRESVELALEAGVDKSRIILDPGVGFAKEYEHNLMVLKNLDKYNALGYPMLLGCSRKSVIGNALELPVGERLEGTLATTMLAREAGYMFVRVHDVKENKRVIEMLDAIEGVK